MSMRRNHSQWLSGFRMHFDALVNNEQNRFARTRVKRFIFSSFFCHRNQELFAEWIFLVVFNKIVYFAYNAIDGFWCRDLALYTWI